MISQEFIRARKFQLHYYRAVPLFYRTNGQRYVLYKQEGQQAFNTQLKVHIATGQYAKVRETIGHIVEETLAEPRSGSLEGIPNTVAILVRDYTRDSQVLKNLLDVSATDYTTAMHSINVMALALAYAKSAGFTPAYTRILGISALLHDVGKTKIDPAILKAERHLTDEEFQVMQRHTILGHEILKNCRFAEGEIRQSALQHHEKGDGSGYPHQRQDISETAQIIGLIDCYEALTNDDRPYRNAMEPLKALEQLRSDVLHGKFNRDKFSNFAHSLVGLYHP